MAGAMTHVWLGADAMITALGVSSGEVFAGIDEGRTGCREVHDPALWSRPFVAGRVDRARVPSGRPNADDTSLERMFIATIGEVVARSGIDPGADDTGLVIASTKGNIELLAGDSAIDERVFPGEMALRVAARCGFASAPVVVSNACVSGVSALIVAARLIRRGRWRNVVVAGGDTLSRFVVTGFQAFRSVSGRVCRPYDAGRDGLTLGEGCGAVLLTADRVRAVEPAVELAGGAIASDANHISGPSRTGDGLFFAIRNAMAEAGVVPAEVDFVNGHGTGTVFNDEMESKAFALAGLAGPEGRAGTGGVAVCGLKPYFGHTLGAAGVIETIVSAQGLRTGTIYGTPGFSESGTPHRLDVSAHHRPTETGVCVKTASGFGGCNAAVVLRKTSGNTVGPPTPPTPPIGVTRQHDAGVKETARVTILPDGRPFGEMIRERFRAQGGGDMKFFRMDNLAKLACVAAGELLAGAGITEKYTPDRVGIVLANSSASLDTDLRHCAQMVANGDEVSPAVFVYTLPNVAAGEVSIRHKIQGEATFFIDSDADRTVEYARMLVRGGRMDAVICGRCELLGEAFEAELILLEKS
jgi:3-oxoacyl-(acyl-carrier-protein) synthase